MKIISDLHLHSKYSRACSKDLDLDNMQKWAMVKGINLLGTGDFTHPIWNKELKTKLEGEDGIYSLKGKKQNNFNFMLTTEISLIYTQERGRKVHNIVWAPDLEVVDQIIEYLLKKGRLDYDGRPIFKIPCPEFTESLKEISEDIEVIPAHVWTPWFGMYGTNSGFDSLKECFQDKANKIYAIETGMSSSPEMNWRIDELKNRAIVSFSDSHSFWPWRLGREATVFDVKKLTYKEIIRQIRNNEVHSTIEVDPGYGKYHFTGHRNCNVVLNAEEARKVNNICPKCKKALTIGVLERVEALANHPEGYKIQNTKPSYTLVPLSELISGYYHYPVASKKTWEIYNRFMAAFKTEFTILLDAEEKELTNVDAEIAKLVMKNRAGKVEVLPGFDGVYGVPVIHGNEQYDFDVKEKPAKVSKKSEGKINPKKEIGKTTTKEQASLSKFF
ncbi:DNA helicase UvrD [Candidatus Woesearchaeota archaeon]|nr:MAG: DNA helicase UvrD [Candidatus Woesearchaeota archaeon]